MIESLPLSAPQRTAVVTAAAIRWLRSTRRCVVVAADHRSYHAIEYPDAIGWQSSGHSILIEVKISVADFKRDLNKGSQRAGVRMGRERWYAAPKGLLSHYVMPCGWGLLELQPSGRMRVTLPAQQATAEGQLKAEVQLLTSAVRRAALGVGTSVTVTPFVVGQDTQQETV